MPFVLILCPLEDMTNRIVHEWYHGIKSRGLLVQSADTVDSNTNGPLRTVRSFKMAQPKAPFSFSPPLHLPPLQQYTIPCLIVYSIPRSIPTIPERLQLCGTPLYPPRPIDRDLFFPFMMGQEVLARLPNSGGHVRR